LIKIHQVPYETYKSRQTLTLPVHCKPN